MDTAKELQNLEKISIGSVFFGITDKVLYMNNHIKFISLIGYQSHMTSLMNELNKATEDNVARLYNYRNLRMHSGSKYDVITKKMPNSDFVHAILSYKDYKDLNDELETTSCCLFFDETYTEDKLHQMLYEKLVKHSSIPVLREWCKFLTQKLTEKGSLVELSQYYFKTQNKGFYLKVNKELIKQIVLEGLKSKEININGVNNPSKKLVECKGLGDYLNTFNEDLTNKVQENFNPKFTPGTKYDYMTDYIDDYIHHKGIELYEAQKSVVQSIVNNWNINKNTILSAEMGGGKTIMSSIAAYVHHANRLTGFNAVIMTPSHLIHQWKDEIEKYIPNSKAFIVNSTSELMELKPMLNNKYRIANYFIIISKEVAKLSYDIRPAAIWSKSKNAWVCPDCGQVLKKWVLVPEKKGSRKKKRQLVPLDKYDFLGPKPYNYKCIATVRKWNAKEEKYVDVQCNSVLWTSLNRDNEKHNWIKLGTKDKGGWMLSDHFEICYRELDNKPKRELTERLKYIKTRLQEQLIELDTKGCYLNSYKGPKKIAIAKYIKEHMKGTFDYFLADEMHLLSAGDSIQGQAFHHLIQSAKHVLGLTGTIVNGYADSLFYIIYRMFPEVMKQEGFNYKDEAEFARLFGVYSKEYSIKDKKSRKVSDKRLPGVSSLLFTKFLLNNTVFLRLEDMTEGLPAYEEIPISIEMDEDTSAGYDVYTDFIEENREDRGLVAKAIKSMLNYPDAPHCAKEILDSDKAVVFSPPKLDKEFRNKDQQLLQLVKDHVEKGEKVLVYYNAVNTTDLGQHLTRLLKDNGFIAKELRTGSTRGNKNSDIIKGSSSERGVNIKKEIDKGMQVLICNPTLVETGLNLLDFTTIIFYQLGYNLSTMRQASRRSWRLSQKNPVTVYFMYYKNTVQEDVLSLMANKLYAASSLEGKFDEEGLRAMSNNQDILTQIAANIVDGIQTNVDTNLFKAHAFIKKSSNKPREHSRTLKDVLIPMNEDGTRQKLLQLRSLKSSKVLDNRYIEKPVRLFI